jgi:hypothetical protein
MRLSASCCILKVLKGTLFLFLSESVLLPGYWYMKCSQQTTSTKKTMTSSCKTPHWPSLSFDHRLRVGIYVGGFRSYAALKPGQDPVQGNTKISRVDRGRRHMTSRVQCHVTFSWWIQTMYLDLEHIQHGLSPENILLINDFTLCHNISHAQAFTHVYNDCNWTFCM